MWKGRVYGPSGYFLIGAGLGCLAILLFILMIAFWQWATGALSSPPPAETISVSTLLHAWNMEDRK